MNEFLQNLDLLIAWLDANVGTLVYLATTIAAGVGAIYFGWRTRRESAAKRALMDGLDNRGNVVAALVDTAGRLGIKVPPRSVEELGHTALRLLRREAESKSIKPIDGEAARRAKLLKKTLAKAKVKG